MITFKKLLALISLFSIIINANLITASESEESAADTAQSDGTTSHVKTNIQFDNTERLSSYNSLLEAVDASASNGELNLDPISFIISKVDMLANPQNQSTIPIIMPASAQLTEPEEEKVVSKRKKNFSKLVKTIMLATKNLHKKNGSLSKDEITTTEEVVTTTTPVPTTTPFDVDTFCQFKDDDTYADPTDCQNFVICYGGKSFKTSCAAGTFYNHFHKDCDYEAKGKKNKYIKSFDRKLCIIFSTVDCRRKPTTTTTTTTESTTTITDEPETVTTTETTTRNPNTSYYLLPRLTTRVKICKLTFLTKISYLFFL
jgi:hypothetical protein